MENQLMIPFNDNKISAALHLPDEYSGEKIPVVVICHGFISNKVGQHRLFVKTARELTAQGFAVMRFDYLGCGDSSGEYRDITLEGQIGETIHILDQLRYFSCLDQKNVTLIGHSFGGCIASYVATLDARVKRLVLWAPVANPHKDIYDIVGETVYQKCLHGQAAHYQGFELGGNFFRSLEGKFPVEAVGKFTGETLIVHGTEDAETPLANAVAYQHALSSRCCGGVTLRIIDNADHTFAAPEWEKQVIEATGQWLGKASSPFS